MSTFWRMWNLGYPTPPAQLRPSPALAEAKSVEAAMRERLAREGAAVVAHLPAAPEPAPERPEWVRLLARTCGYDEGTVLIPAAWDEEGDPGIEHADSDHVSFIIRGAWEPADPPTPEPPVVPTQVGIVGGEADVEMRPEPPAEWKVGDWFTVANAWIDRLRRTEGGYDANLTSSTPYRVERWQTGDVPGFGPGAIFDQGCRYVPASHMSRCDPPSDPQPDEMVAVMLPRWAIEYHTERHPAELDTNPYWAVTAACRAALSQEGGQP